MLTWLTQTIPPRPLGLARILVGAASLSRVFVAAPILFDLTRPEVLVTPYVDWLPAPSVPVAIGILLTWGLSAVLFTIGWRVSLTGTLLALVIGCTLLLDQQTYSNHLYLMAWLVLLLTIADSGAGLAIRGREREVVRWPVVLLKLQVSIVYGFSALTKINEDFLSGSVLAGVLRGGVIPLPEALRNPRFLSLLAGLVVVVELFVALFMWLERFRPYAFLVGLGLHVGIVALMDSTAELAVFAVEMLAIYPLFLSEVPARLSGDQRWMLSADRFNLIRLLETGVRPGPLTLTTETGSWTGGPAHGRALERLVPWLWVAPVLRLPGIAQLHAARHRDTRAAAHQLEI